MAFCAFNGTDAHTGSFLPVHIAVVTQVLSVNQAWYIALFFSSPPSSLYCICHLVYCLSWTYSAECTVLKAAEWCGLCNPRPSHLYYGRSQSSGDSGDGLKKDPEILFVEKAISRIKLSAANMALYHKMNRRVLTCFLVGYIACGSVTVSFLDFATKEKKKKTKQFQAVSFRFMPYITVQRMKQCTHDYIECMMNEQHVSKRCCNQSKSC